MLGRVPVRWVSAVLLALLSVLLIGYGYEGQDNELWIPFIRHAADPGLYARDPVISSPQGSFTFYVDALGALSRVIPLEWCLFVLFLTCHVLSFVGIAELAFALFRDELSVLLALCLWCVPHPLGWTGAWTLSDSMIPRRIAEALLPFAMAAAVGGRAWLTGGLAFGMMLAHPLSAACVLPSLAAGVVRRGELWKLGVLVALAAAGAASVLLHGFPPPEAPVAFSDEAWLALLRRACPYAFASSASGGTWLGLLVTLGLLAGGWLHGRLPRAAARMAAAALAWVGLTALVGEGLGLPVVLQLQSGRGLAVPVLLGLLVGAASMADQWRSSAVGAALAGALLGSVALGATAMALLLLAVASLDASRSGGPGRCTAGLVIASACAAGALASSGPIVGGNVRLDVAATTVIVGAAVLGVALRTRALEGRECVRRHAWLVVPASFVVILGGRAIEVPWAPAAQDAEGLRRWARTHTPVDTLFAVPGTARGFRGAALRSSVLEMHDVHASFFSRRYAAEWIERRRRFADDVPIERRVAALRDGTIDVLVTHRLGRRLKEPVAYQDNWYVAYVRPGSPLAASP